MLTGSPVDQDRRIFGTGLPSCCAGPIFGMHRETHQLPPLDVLRLRLYGNPH